MDDLKVVSRIAVFGLKAQAERLRVVSQNLSNADSVAETAGSDPYRRRVISFKSVMDRELDTDVVKTGRVREDMSPFGREYDPGHPAADADGYVTTANVNPMVELMDMREAQRSYEANLNVIKVTREMTDGTIDLLR